MIFGSRDKIINKLKKGETLDKNELRIVEISLTMYDVYDEVLNEALGISPNKFNLITAIKNKEEKNDDK